jgi:hypothetical protein
MMSLNIIQKDILLEILQNEGVYNIIELLSNNNQKLVINKAYAAISIGKKLHRTIGLNSTFTVSPLETNLGKGSIYKIDFQRKNPSDPIHLQLNIAQYQTGAVSSFLTFELIATNESDQVMEINSISPITVNKKNDGGVFLAAQPDDLIAFENGLSFALEFFPRAVNAREESESMYMQMIYLKEDHSKNLLLGLLSLEPYLPEVMLNEDDNEGLVIDGREGIAEWRAHLTFPFPKKLNPGDSLSSGIWVLRLNAPSGFIALEDYANWIRIYNNIRLWQHDIPHGWNSWNNPVDGFREYSYVTDVNEEVILSNMDIAIKNLKNFGLKYWQLDSGYAGNLLVDEVDEQRFPHGMKYIADKIHEQGLKAGIWINPFNVGIDSQLYKEKVTEGWFPTPDPSFPVQDKKWRSFDLSIPEVQNHIRRFVRKVVKEWGYDCLKVDFSYMNMAPREFANKSMTATEIHKLGFQLIREEAGPDIFIYGIGGPIGLHFGLVDGERIGLDTLPVWHAKGMPSTAFDTPQTSGSVLLSARTFLRRYFYHDRLWIHHLDCFSFRPSLTSNEALVLATLSGLMGGIWKMGDKMQDMKPEHFAIVQKMLPIYRESARPIDLFRTLIPEIVHLQIRKPTFSTEVIGVFHWGPNKNLLTEEIMLDSRKNIIIDFQELAFESAGAYHAFDFWNEQYLGVYTKDLSIEIEPRHVRVFALQKVQEHPQFISDNRHLTQGYYTISNPAWNSDASGISKLTMDVNVVEGFEHHLYFYIPPNYMVRECVVNSEDGLNYQIDGSILKITIIGKKNSTSSLNIQCGKT